MISMKIEIQYVKGMTFVGKGDTNHWVVMDGPAIFGGTDAGTRPMELFLIALGGCTGMDVVSLLRKMKVNFTDFKISITVERKEEHPKIFTKIHIKYMIWGDVPEDEVKKAIDLSQNRYCPISEISRKSAEVTYEYEIFKP